MYDLIIIGGSAAGCSAAIYAARRNLNFLLITADWGGEVARSGWVCNYLGFDRISGFELANIFKKQAIENKSKICENTTVEKINIINNIFEIIEKSDTEPKKWQAKSIILATGSQPRKLNLPGENELRGKGVSYCSTCDGPLYRNKRVIVIGGGNAGMESALMLKDICEKVYLIEVTDVLRGEKIYMEKIAKEKKIVLMLKTKPLKIIGENKVESIEVEINNKKQTIKTDGIFIHVGTVPNSDMAPKEIAKDKFGYISTNKLCETNLPGFYAVGDVADLPFKQISIAVGQGTTALLSVAKYLESK
ncbi:MAG: thioredoxin reductase (NADPH) [Candidatus Berkelbacteria bacterium Licking1014_85]|uniref:Thioredoxin reductase (NADPH) n=1 Tax=Candidatus Berkelbacteria bacterium Licking1014_85 TaxID=2017148 RepID=A0A554LH55_9BACT|nr:MAG: thioredoxin reductase (NADPH) [Candidatus Berkelbacteria bacterium Licking1014_85]